jgi:hypothetical protein
LEDSFGSESDRKCEVVHKNGTSEIVLDSNGKSPNHWGREGKFYTFCTKEKIK